MNNPEYRPFVWVYERKPALRKGGFLMAAGTAALILASFFYCDADGLIPVRWGTPAEAAVDSAFIYEGGYKKGLSHCIVHVNFQVEPGFAPHESVEVARELCPSLKQNDRMQVRYLRLGKESVWVAPVNDGGYRRRGAWRAILTLALPAAYVLLRLIIRA